VQGLGLGLIVTATNISLGLVAAELMWRDPTAGWLLIVPITVLFFAYRAYNSEREKHQSLEFLYETTRTAQRYLNLDQALYTLLNQARQMFRAELADITLLPADGEELHRQTTLGPGDEYKLMEPVALDPTEGVWARVVSEGAAVLVRRPMQNERLREHYAAQGIRDIMVAPLVVEDGVIGTLRVANRLGDVSTFDNEDLKLFETLANHATVSLENARLVAQLQSSLTHLTEMNRLKDDFVASVSHELRTPLTSIQGYVKTLLRPGVDFTHDERHSFLSAVDRQSTRLATLIEDLLVVARLESNRLSLTLSPVSLPVVAERVVEELRVRAKDRAFKVSFAPDLSAVEGDEGKIHQIVSNLVDNALKYSPEDAPVSIAGMAEGDGVTISVTDFGPGIPADVQDKVFDRFYQVDQSATRKVGGAGLGLYICKSLATAFGGRLWLERSDETGSTFSLWIPATPPTELPPLIQSKVHPIGHAVNTL
jgi:signal transduction histidine kinase